MNQPDRRTWMLLGAGSVVGMAIAATPASAHTGHEAAGLWSGITHPVLGLDHVFAMVTVGIVATVLARTLAVPGAFLATMTLGSTLGFAGMPLPRGEALIAVSVIALGGALIAGASLCTEAALGLVGIAGFAHGHAHGLEAPSAAHPIIYVAGFLLATAVLHTAGVGIGVGIREHVTRRASAGSLVIGAGIGLMAGVI